MFEKVIGYEGVKAELVQLVDIIRNRDKYENKGAKVPCGLLIYGAPGVGKSVLSQEFINQTELPYYIIRKDKTRASIIESITETFKKAKDNSPSIVFLDDMDKLSNEDNRHCDTEEYVTIQSCIDNVKGCGVFVLATVNDITKLPRSLKRVGRFDRKIEITPPSYTDAKKIIEYYLKDKPVDKDLNYDDLGKMINYKSCVELENLINESTLLSIYQGKEKVDIDDIKRTVLRLQYKTNDDDISDDVTDEEIDKIAYHEAGHTVISELLKSGCVGLVNIRKSKEGAGGFTHRYIGLDNDIDYVYVSVAGKIATSLYYPDFYDGNISDYRTAAEDLREIITVKGKLGNNHLETNRYSEMTYIFDREIEILVAAEMNRIENEVRKMLMDNREFLEKVHDELIEKEALLASDIKRIKESVGKGIKQ